MHDRVAPLVQEAFAHLQNDVFCALPPAYPEEVAARQIGGYARSFLPTHSRSCPLSRPWVTVQRDPADRIFMRRRPRGNVRICRKSGACVRLSGVPSVLTGREPPIAGGALRGRSPRP